MLLMKCLVQAIDGKYAALYVGEKDGVLCEEHCQEILQFVKRVKEGLAYPRYAQ
jgi:hypothetical protein